MKGNLLRRLDQLEQRRCVKVPPLEIIVDFTDGETDPEKIETVSTREGMIIETVLTLKEAERDPR